MGDKDRKWTQEKAKTTKHPNARERSKKLQDELDEDERTDDDGEGRKAPTETVLDGLVPGGHVAAEGEEVAVDLVGVAVVLSNEAVDWR